MRITSGRESDFGLLSWACNVKKPNKHRTHMNIELIKSLVIELKIIGNIKYFAPYYSSHL
jgi:hypothetical protein